MTTMPAPDRRRTKRKLSYEEYLALPDDGRIVEWVDGEIIRHMPTTPLHQNVVIFLIKLLSSYIDRLNLGHLLAAPVEVRLWPDGPAREPDVLFIGRERLGQLTERRFEGGPDLVVEVVSPGSVTIDRVDKFLEYERAGVSEYWLIDPDTETVEQYRLAGDSYELAIKAQTGELRSFAVSGFEIPVRALFDEQINQATLRQLLNT